MSFYEETDTVSTRKFHLLIFIDFFPIQFSLQKLAIRFKRNKTSSVTLCSWAFVPANALDRYLYFPVLCVVVVALCLNMSLYVILIDKFVSQINQFDFLGTLT